MESDLEKNCTRMLQYFFHENLIYETNIFEIHTLGPLIVRPLLVRISI